MSLKRYAMPRHWRIELKTKKFILSLKPGPHNTRTSIPLGMFLRDIMKFAATMKEARQILNKGDVRIDGIPRKDANFPLGIMDFVSINDKSFIALPGKKGMVFKEFKNTSVKLAKISGKRIVRKGKVQLSLYNGHNILVEEHKYSTGDTLMINTDSKAIRGALKFVTGSYAIITDGRNVGRMGRIKKIIQTEGSGKNIVVLESDKMDLVVPKDYVFVVGEDKPVLDIGE